MAQPKSVNLEVSGLPMSRGTARARGRGRGETREHKDVDGGRRRTVNAELAGIASQVRGPEADVTFRRMGSRAPHTRGSRERE